MPIAMEVVIDERELMRLRRMFQHRQGTFRQILRRSLNRGASASPSRIARRIAAVMPLPKEEIRRHVHVRLATGQRLTATFTVWGSPTPLIRLSAWETARGVAYQGVGSRKLAKGAFIATMPRGRTAVFRRRGVGRLPIRELYGPSIPDVFDRSAIEHVARRAGDDVVRTLDRQVKRELEKAAT